MMKKDAVERCTHTTDTASHELQAISPGSVFINLYCGVSAAPLSVSGHPSSLS